MDKKCKGLYLTGNKITHQSISILSDALYSNITLVELDLSDNHLSDSGVQILVDVLSSNRCRLEKLHLGSNHVTDQGVQYLSNMLNTNRSLTHLMLNRNQISNRGVHVLANVLALQNRSLEVLSLSCNSFITDGSIDALIVMIKHNDRLKGLDVKCCNMSETNTQRLRASINQKNDFKLYTDSLESSCRLS